MTIAHDCARADDSDREFLIIRAAHLKKDCGSSLTLRCGERSTPDGLASQSPAFCGSEESLDRPGYRRQLTHLQISYVESLQHHRIKSHARKCDSPPWYGQEEGRRRPARHEKCAADLQPQPARTPCLGA